MTETYRKRGTVVRWENGVLVQVREHGVAVEDGDLFRCHPEPQPERDAAVDRESVARMARDIEALVPPPLRIERLIVADGTAEHECAGRTWGEQMRRIHLSIVQAGHRVLIDLGDTAAMSETRAALDLTSVVRTVDALQRIDLTAPREAPPRLRLAPNVAAALTPSLLGLAPPNVRIVQRAGGVDGKGLPIVEAEGDWPNWYRPSYRVRPVRMPLHLAVECDVDVIEPDRPIAVALLAPVQGDLMLQVLVDDGERSFPCAVRVTRIDAVAREARWYPYGSGSFGAEMML